MFVIIQNLIKESIDAIKKLRKARYRIYNQHPLLKNVNDDIQTLIKLYDKMRRIKNQTTLLISRNSNEGYVTSQNIC